LNKFVLSVAEWISRLNLNWFLVKNSSKLGRIQGVLLAEIEFDFMVFSFFKLLLFVVNEDILADWVLVDDSEEIEWLEFSFFKLFVTDFVAEEGDNFRSLFGVFWAFNLEVNSEEVEYLFVLGCSTEGRTALESGNIVLAEAIGERTVGVLISSFVFLAIIGVNILIVNLGLG